MSQHPPFIAILTDFGLSDWYVASMKGVIATICPNARVVDITHQIAPGDVASASFVLTQCYRDFPQGTIFLCVVDPGVGSKRLPLIVYDGDYHFVAPDNGLLSGVAQGMQRTFVIDPHRNPQIVRHSATFHGRDIFAPTAAMLALGVPPNDLGHPTFDVVSYKPSIRVARNLPAEGELLYFDHFGNAISNLQLDFVSPKCLTLENGDSIPFLKTYSSVPVGNPVAYLGSSGFVELAINAGNATESLSLLQGARFQLS